MNAGLVLVHHTRPAVGADLCYGRAEVELAPGWPRDLADCIAKIPPAQRVMTSPSLRCRALARELGRRDAVPVQIDDRLQEMDFGRWEGRAWREIPRDGVDRWMADLWNYAPGNGESLCMLWARLQSWREDVLDRSAEALVVITHAGPIRALLALVSGAPAERMFTRRIPWGDVLRVEPAMRHARINRA